MMRRVLLTLWLLLGLWSVAQFFPPRHPTGPTRAAVAACHARPEPPCLLDIGVAVLLAEREPSHPLRWIAPLVASERIGEAQAILVRHATREGSAPEEALATALRHLARHRIERGIRSGMPVEEALARVPEANGSDLYFAARDLLDPALLGGLVPSQPELLLSDRRAAVAALASAILAIHEEDPKRVAAFQLDHAANLFADLGDRAGVLRALRIVKRAGSDMVGLYDHVYHVAGPDAVLDLVDLTDPGNAILLERAAGAERDTARANSLLQQAFEIHATKEIWPDFDDMLRVVERAVSRGLPDTARALAHRMVEIAQIDHRNPFELFDHIDAAEALLLAGAGREEVFAELGRAQALFPPDPDEVVAVGLVAGPMSWEGFGLADEARGRIAGIRASLGDLDGAIRLLGAANEPLSVWGGVTGLDLALPDLDRLLAAAHDQLPTEEVDLISARFAAAALHSDRSPEHASWAMKIIRDIAADPARLAAQDGRVAWTVVALAGAQGDMFLRQRALVVRAQFALENEDGPLLVRIAQEMTAPPRP